MPTIARILENFILRPWELAPDLAWLDSIYCTYTLGFIYYRLTIVYTNIYSSPSHFSSFSHLEGFPHISCLYHGNTITYFVQIVPGGMTNFVLGIDRWTSTDSPGRNGQFWLGFPGMNGHFYISYPGRNGHYSPLSSHGRMWDQYCQNLNGCVIVTLEK